ncbi:peptidoglycan DD-metalloendopeptidase family protein [Isachenkonia alkalipeptolytica]|uniref:Peptidoglycan DD-metalloendopeptidase family protein n=1 Tax=Isachenkonia alkalipeptolytica TaxID=2565777 RepID=A0AA43XJ87_9CLOT|nr:peptidoglycan DD-metalloendopeptidase family protein [Isachenkonia alkalipeptolytica]NBG87349.1 hypothetical protein [Isachenkonia alkalipeptolytica]
MKKRKFLCLMMVFLLLISPALFSFAEEVDEVQDQLKEVEEEQREIEAKIEENEMEESEIIEKLEEIEMEIIEAEREIDDIESNISRVTEDIEVTEEELLEAKAGLGDKNELLGTRVAAMYRKGSISYIEILFGSRDFTELLSNMDMIRKIADHDVQLIEELEEQAALVAAKQDILEDQKSQLLSYQQDVENKVETLQVSRGTQKRLRVEIQSTIAEMEQELSEREEESEYLEGEIQRIEREIQERMEAEKRAAEEQARKEAEEQARREAERKAEEEAEREASEEEDAAEEREPEPEESEEEEEPSTPAEANRSWPVPGYRRISSAYGYRTHPIFGEWRPHWGIDIPAPMGTPIVASLSGEVMLSTYGPSYGNYVVIYHGEGISTLYAHNSQNHVSVGDRVEQGEVIASIGSTGYSTGPHLHYEVRVNGDPKVINPYHWLNE